MSCLPKVNWAPTPMPPHPST